MLFATLLTPVAVVLFRKQAASWGSSDYAAYEVLSISLLIFTCDCLLNGMFNPLFLVIAGAITTRPASSTLPEPALNLTELPQSFIVQRDLRHINGATAASRPALLEN